MRKDILDFYRQTGPFTELGLYRDFAASLPDDIHALCRLQRSQTIHPVGLLNPNTRMDTEGFWGNLSEIPLTRLNFEEDYFPTAMAIFGELLRLNPAYSESRTAKDKLHITCRCQAILLAATLKAKGIPARVRSGFAGYIKKNGEHADHWITEYYDERTNRWILADADIFGDPDIDFNPTDIPRERFLTGPEAYLKLRSGAMTAKEISYASWPVTYGLPAAIRGVFYELHALMNHEIIFLHQPSYIADRAFMLTEEEYRELDALAELLLDPDRNFDAIRHIWETEPKYRILRGGLN